MTPAGVLSVRDTRAAFGLPVKAPSVGQLIDDLALFLAKGKAIYPNSDLGNEIVLAAQKRSRQRERSQFP